MSTPLKLNYVARRYFQVDNVQRSTKEIFSEVKIFEKMKRKISAYLR